MPRRIRKTRRRRRRVSRRASRRQRGGASYPKGYPDSLVLSYTPTSNPGDPDVVPRIGSEEAFLEQTEDTRL